MEEVRRKTNRGGLESQVKQTDPNLWSAYQAVTAHWTHAEQLRWTILYNFLVATTILLLAWATAFASARAPGVRLWVLIIMCGTGMVLSIAWAGLGMRGNSFVRMYAKLGQDAEMLFPETIPRPFQEAESHRRGLSGPASVPSWLIIGYAPLVFLSLYGGLA